MSSMPLIKNRNVLIVGEANTGKSTSLHNLINRERYAYINTDGKALPFGGAPFLCNVVVNHPSQLFDQKADNGGIKQGYITQLENSDKCQGIIYDTLSFLMAQYERKIVPTYDHLKAGWGAYAMYYEKLIEYIKTSNKYQIVLAHTDTKLNTQSALMETSILVKGSVGRRGVDADFSIVVSCKQMPLIKLEEYQNPMLNFTEEEKLMGMKYVFQTKLNKETIGDRTRSPIGMWDFNETYIDNNVQYVLNRMEQYYN